MSTFACDLTVLAGTQPAVKATFRNEAGVLVDPTGIQATTLSPAKVPTVYTWPGAAEIAKDISEEPIGVWRFTFPGPLTETGKWIVQIAGTVGVIAVNEVTVNVKKTKV
jgi:hypothetical protein